MGFQKFLLMLKNNKTYKIIKKYNSKGNDISYKAVVDQKTFLEGKNKIGEVSLLSSMVGFASYIGSGLLNFTKIGRFSSIGNNVKIISSTHPDFLVSTHPGFYKSVNKCFFPGNCNFFFDEFLRVNDDYHCVIGNDVWIGDNVILKGGVTIGDGAIVGMGSLVTKDVPPYAVVCGVPAKIIRYRFDDDTIKSLLTIKWWEFDPTIIDEKKELFSNVDEFLKEFSIKNKKQ